MLAPRTISVAVALPVLAGGALLLSAGGAVASPQSFPVSLSASNEPQGGVPGSSGSATVTVDPASGQVCATVTTSVTNGVAMHIHRGAPGADGPVVVPFEAKDINAGRACVAADTAVATAIAADPSAYYLNIHTEAAPAGALRGQLAAATPTGVDAGSGGAASPGPGTGTTAALVVLMVAGAGVAGSAGWRLVRR